MDRVTYQDLVARFGEAMAFDLLITIEKLAKAKDTLYPLDENTRLQKRSKLSTELIFLRVLLRSMGMHDAPDQRNTDQSRKGDVGLVTRLSEALRER